uniref:Uncharacterized protein n=1 Tax=Setaria italica TaxID=4555 RepID=K3YFP3_SETIT
MKIGWKASRQQRQVQAQQETRIKKDILRDLSASAPPQTSWWRRHQPRQDSMSIVLAIP